MILVTGGTGFLGAHLAKKLVAAGKSVCCLYREKIPEHLFPETEDPIEWRQADILDVCSLEPAMKDIKEVFHCAGVVSFQPSDRDLLMQVNVEGTANVVNLAIEKGIRKLVHVSSVAALGRASHGNTIDESCKWEDSRNNSAYAKSKFLGEMEVWRGIGEGLDAVIVNPSVLLGEAVDWNAGSSSLVKNAYNEFPWYTTGINGFVDVKDVARAMILLMESDISGERFILNGENCSYQKLFTQMALALGKKPPHRKAVPWMGELVWRLEKIKSAFSHSTPLLTRETARTAQLKVYYDARKIQEYLPDFHFTPFEQTIHAACCSFLTASGKLPATFNPQAL